MVIVTKALGSYRIIPLVLAAALLFVFTYLVFALPSVTYVSPTLSDNTTTGSNWVYVNVTSSENLNQSLLEWGNASGFTNVSMGNSSLTNWYKNMTGLADYTYNYTIFAQNTTGDWNQTGRRWVTVDTTPPTEPTLISPANNTNSSDNTPDLDWATVTEINFRNYTVQVDDNSTFSSPNYIYNTTNISDSNYTVTSAWADGRWYWRVIAYDNASNSNTSGYFAYTADTTAPTITLDAPRNGSVIRNGTWINLTITDLTSVNASWWSNNSGTANYTLTSPWDINTTGWSEGDKAIDVWANDSFGFLRRNTSLFRIDDTPPYNTTACQDLTIAGGYYTLTQNVSSSGTCFNILANNITLDGQGYWVNYSQSVTGYGVNNAGGYDNITIKNLNIILGNGSVNNAYAVYASGMTNSTITNNSIRPLSLSGAYDYGIYLTSSNSNIVSNNIIRTGYNTAGNIWAQGIVLLSSSANNLTNNDIATLGDASYGVHLDSSNSNKILDNNVSTSRANAYAIYLEASNNNNITGGSITGSTRVYGIRNTGSTNNFTNTNFTASRGIYFDDIVSWFNYNNQTGGNIWLKTSISVGSRYLERTLVTWSQSQMKWNDTNSSAGVTANYNLTGLLANTQYKVYNTSQGVQTNPYTLSTDASGNLPSFTILLNGNTEVNVSIFTGNNPPTAILNSPINNYNQTSASITFNCTAYDDLNLTNVTLYNNFNGWQANGTNTSGINNTAYVFDRVAPSNGTFTWNCLAYDNSSQSSFASQNYSFTIDGVPPTSNSPNDASHSQGASATINWTLYDNYAPGYYIAYRNGTIQNQSTWTNNTNLSVWVNTSTQGTWNYTITYNDSLGNSGNPDTAIITITGDTTPPTITFVSPTWNNNTNRSENWEYVNITLNEPGNVSLLEWNNGTTTNYTMQGSGTNFYRNMTNQNGTITYKVYANDTAGNMNVSETRIVTLNTTSSCNSYVLVNPGGSIQTAINSICSTGGTVELAAGTFILPINNTLNITTANFIFKGQGKTSTFLDGSDSNNLKIRIGTEPPNLTQPESDFLNNITISNFYISGSSGSSDIGIRLFNVRNYNISNMEITAVYYGIVGTMTASGNINNNYLHNTVGTAILGNQMNTTNISQNTFDSVGLGVQFNRQSAWGNLDFAGAYNLIDNNSFHACTSNSGCVYLYSTTTDTTVKNNLINYTKYTGIMIYGGGRHNIFNNRIMDQWAGAGGEALIAIRPDTTSNSIYNNILKGTASSECIDSTYGIPLGGSYNPPINTSIYNNVMTGCNGDGFFDNYNSTGIFKNNIVVNNSGYGIRLNISRLVGSYNDVWNNTLGNYNGTSAGTGDISADPLFANASAGDFHLKSQTGRWNGTGWVLDSQTSPAIDAGDPSSNYSLEPAPNGGRINMGAYGGTSEASKTYSANSLTACGDLSTANTYYTLTQNVSSSGTCFNILANNITLDGQGYTVNYSQSIQGYGIDNTGGYDNITIKNLNIVQGSTTSYVNAIYGNWMTNSNISNNNITVLGDFGGGIYLQNSDTNVFSNNTITTSGTYGHGINIYSSSANVFSNNTITTSNSYAYGIYIDVSSANVFSNNTITTSGSNSYGIYLLISNTNNIIGGSVISKQTYDYYLRSAGTTNNFTNTNFTAQRRIYFDDTSTSSWFNYNNETNGNIWLKTSISVNAATLTRALSTWSQSQMKWNDTNGTAGITASYDLTGLQPNTNYRITNSSKTGTSTPYTITTDINGALNFTIRLIDNTEIEVRDILPPSIVIQSPTNRTYAQKWVWANLTLSEAGSWCGASLNNTANQTLTNTTGKWWMNLTVPSEGANNVKFYCNDTAGNMGNSSTVYFTVDTIAPVLTFVNITPNNTQTNSSWAYINITSSESLSAALLEWNGTAPNLTMSGSGTNFYYNKTGLANGNYTFKVYANDTANNWNVTETRWVYANYTAGYPKYSNISANTTQRNSSALFAAYWTDTVGLSGFTFSTNNSGAWANYSSNFSGTGNWSNYTITLNSTIGLAIGYIFYANNTNGNWNSTAINTLTTGCLESWSYSDWSACSGGTQTKTASDSNYCGTTVNRSALSQSCSSGTTPSGGGGGGATVTLTKTIVITPNESVKKVTVNLKIAVENPSLTVVKALAVPVSAPSGTVYQYLNITRKNFNNSDIGNATVEFIVNRSWISKNNFTNVYLGRYDNGWNRLRTELVNSTDTVDYYIAYTNGFSYFAIVGEVKAMEAPVCTENWSCSEWSACENDKQSRICRDLSSCNTTASKPEGSRACKAEKPIVKPMELPVVYITIAVVGIAAILAGILYIAMPKKRRKAGRKR